METFRLLLFTTLWTAIWAASIATISRRWRLATIRVMPAVGLASLMIGLNTAVSRLSVDPSTTSTSTSP